MNMIIRGTLILAGVSCLAGDLAIEGNLNVTSNLTSWSLSTSRATVGLLVVEGETVLHGPMAGNGAGLTNLNFATAKPASITSDKLAAGAVTATALAANSVGSSAIASGAVTSAKLGANSVGSTAIASGAVTSAKLAAGSVGTNNAVQSEWNAWASVPINAHNTNPTSHASLFAGKVDRMDTNGWTVSAHDAWITLAQVPAQTQQAYVAAAGTAGTVTGVQSQLLTSALQPASIINLVPYTGAASSVNLGTNSMTAKSFIGDGSGLTNLTVVATLPASSVTADNLASGAVTTEKIADGAVSVVKVSINDNLSMGGNRLTNLSAPVADGDAVSKAYLRSVLSALPPQGDLSMGSFTNGAPTSFPLTL